MTIGTVARCYLVFLSLYHVVTGIVSMFLGEAALKFYRGLYACNPVESRHLFLVLKPWGALAAFAGAAGLCAAVEPRRYAGVIHGLLALLVFRFYYRARYEHMLFAVSGIPPHRNRVNLLLIAAGAALLGAWCAVGLI